MKVIRADETTSWKDQDLGGKRPGKSVCISRYGAIGDVLQAVSVFPELKRQGYYTCLNCKEEGYNLVKHDPHIDEVFIQPDEFVRNDAVLSELSEYWEKLGENFTKFVTLSNVVEGGLLVMPSRPEYHWNQKQLHEVMNKNYLEALHNKAELPHSFEPCFYPSESERKWAKAKRKKMGRHNFVAMWSLAGSSVHKVWPYTDIIIARMMLHSPNIKVVTVGEELCQVLEGGWENEKRVLKQSGKWTIRQSLAFAEECDLVIGTETGLLNSVGMREVAKICFLSHSSKENLTKHWKNTIALEPEGVDCYPCHRLHLEGFRTCYRDEKTGAAECAARISPDMAWEAILEVMK